MGLRLKNSSGNYVELNAPSSIATDFGLTLPVNDGDSGQYLQTNGTGTLSWQTVTEGLTWTESTATSTSGATVNFGSIPSEAKEICIGFKDVSVSTTVTVRWRLGTSSGLATSGYQTLSVWQGASTGYNTSTSYCEFYAGNSSTVGWDGFVRLINISENVWQVSGQSGDPGYNYLMTVNSSIDLGAALTQVEFFLGAGNFDAGSWVIRYLA